MNADKISDRAINIYQHILRKGPVAVFKIGDTFRTAKAWGELAEKAFEKTPQSFVGVYDSSCDVKWIEEDLQYMNNKK